MAEYSGLGPASPLPLPLLSYYLRVLSALTAVRVSYLVEQCTQAIRAVIDTRASTAKYIRVPFEVLCVLAVVINFVFMVSANIRLSPCL